MNEDQESHRNRRPWAIWLGASLTIASGIALALAVVILTFSSSTSGRVLLVFGLSMPVVCVAPFLWAFGLGKLGRSAYPGFGGGRTF